MSYPIKSIKAREILDSRGNPTIEVDVLTKAGIARAAVPSGASTGIHEALELRDKGKRYGGKGVLKAVKNINTKINNKLKHVSVESQELIDTQMIQLDKTDNKKNLGANAILGVSMAVARAGAANLKIPLYEYLAKLSGNKKLLLPIPFCNIINGGKHAGNELDIQEFMIAPVGARKFSDAIRMASETYYALKEIIEKNHGKNAINVGDEGGFAPPLQTPDQALDLIMDAIKQAGYKGKIKIAMDAAASEFYKSNGKYLIEGREHSGIALLDKYKYLVHEYPIISIEDPFEQDDFSNFYAIQQELGKKVQIVGDDLLVTNKARIEEALKLDICNALLLKVNQIGTLTEAIKAARLAMKYKWGVMVSHRSGETEDSFIADLAVGLGTGQIKSGAPCRSERLAKYNQLLRIEEELGKKAKFAMWKK
ncbi:phosphopyruvate hydratase [Candidatus Woesearchaeota archaeon]|nr:phosphopyruvate hydratase [Candidatus Woesearchaeota archaeon]